MNTISSLPPPLVQHLSEQILKIPMPKFYEDSTTLWSIYQYIKINLQKKTYYHENSDKKFLELERIFLDLYDKILQKEKDIEAKTGMPAQRTFNYFDYPDKYRRKLFRRLEHKT